MNFLRYGLIVLGVGALATWPACSTDMTGLEPLAQPATGGATFASGGSRATDTGGNGPAGTGGLAETGGSSASGGDSGSGGDTIGSGGSGGEFGTGTGGHGTGGAGTGGRAGSGGTASGGAATGGRVGSGGTASGGASTGGRVGTGGAATGGAATGGRPGTGGVMGTGGAMAKPECATAADCRLLNDCCACRAVPVNGPVQPACALFCLQLKCAQQQLPPDKVACVAGRCVAGFDCNTADVGCGQATPACPLGMVPSVTANGNCYSGSCVLATQCLRVDSCAACSGTNQACVTEPPKDGDTQRHCATIPLLCQGTATCGCFGPSTCVAPNTTCTNLSGVKGVACSD